MPDVFISYSHQDIDIARKIDHVLTRIGIDVWRDERISPGVKFDDEIREQLRSSAVCLFLISPSFLSSSYCQNEVGFAEAHQIAFLPCLLHQCELTGFLASRQYFRLLGLRNNKLRRRKLVYEVAKSLTRVGKENLRLELLDFYKSKQRLFNQNGRSAVPLKKPEQPAKDPAYVLSNILDRLGSGESIEELFLNLSPHDREYSVALPGWRIHAPSLNDIDENTKFPVLPDLILYERVFDREKVIEAWVAFLREYHPREFGYPFSLINTLAFRPLYDEQWLSAIGWTDTCNSQGELVFFPSKGVYRVAIVTERFGRTNVVFTKYLSIEATRIKLGLGSYAPDDIPRLKSSSARANLPETLEVMYQGCYNEELSFLLYNNSKSIALVQSIDVVVHKVAPRKAELPISGALVIEHRYKVTLRPEVCRINVTKQNFKYSPGDVDKFTMGLRSESPGYDYQVSAIVEWVDISDGKRRVIETPTEVIAFPLYRD